MSKHVLNEMSFDATIELLQNHELFIALLWNFYHQLIYDTFLKMNQKLILI